MQELRSHHLSHHCPGVVSSRIVPIGATASVARMGYDKGLKITILPNSKLHQPLCTVP